MNNGKPSLTKEQALQLVGSSRGEGTVIGVDYGGRNRRDGVYLVIVFSDKQAEYEKVG